MHNSVDLSLFSSRGYNKGASTIKIILWYFVNAFFVRCSWNVLGKTKKIILAFFGAKIGSGIVIKNEVIIKYPWYFKAGKNVWLGEKCWIDNIARVELGDNVCISQGALLLTGNHDYKKADFPYRNGDIKIEDGAWIGARAVVCSGVTVHSHAVLTAGSVATKDLDAYGVYQGNPAVKIRCRHIDDNVSPEAVN